ncbi:MAG: hypothetical protein FWE32_05280 [Oscillospiraceae bacterium]|nr:hypothetical protein [Oscillospiraceae bacterium]
MGDSVYQTMVAGCYGCLCSVIHILCVGREIIHRFLVQRKVTDTIFGSGYAVDRWFSFRVTSRRRCAAALLCVMQ